MKNRFENPRLRNGTSFHVSEQCPLMGQYPTTTHNLPPTTSTTTSKNSKTTKQEFTAATSAWDAFPLLSVLVVILYPLHVPGTHAYKMPHSVWVKWIDHVSGSCLWRGLFCVYTAACSRVMCEHLKTWNELQPPKTIYNTHKQSNTILDGQAITV